MTSIFEFRKHHFREKKVRHLTLPDATKVSTDFRISTQMNNSRQVAEKLKIGQTVEPETYEHVTIFFSDVVSFTTLSR